MPGTTSAGRAARLDFLLLVKARQALALGQQRRIALSHGSHASADRNKPLIFNSGVLLCDALLRLFQQYSTSKAVVSRVSDWPHSTQLSSPDALRLVSYFDTVTGKCLKFMTNNFTLPALTIAQIYKQRGQVEALLFAGSRFEKTPTLQTLQTSNCDLPNPGTNQFYVTELYGRVRRHRHSDLAVVNVSKYADNNEV